MDIDIAKKKIALELEEALSLDKAPSIDVEATLDLLFRFLDYKPDDKSISGESGLVQAFENKDYRKLAAKIEVFIKTLIYLIDRSKYEELKREKNPKTGAPNSLYQWAGKGVDLKTADKGIEGITEFSVRKYFKELSDIRNDGTHNAPEYSSSQEARIYTSACVIYSFLINKYADEVKLMLMSDKSRAYLESLNKDYAAASNSYVEILVESSEEGVEAASSYLGLQSKEQIQEKEDEPQSEQREQNEFEASSLLDRKDKIILRGGGGAGKSTVLQNICIRNVGGLLDNNSSRSFLPIFIVLNQLWYRKITIMDYIRENVPGLPDAELLSGRIIIMLDGLNEVKDPEYRRLLNKEIESILSRLNGAKLIITTRPCVSMPEHDFSYFDIKEMDEARVKDYVSKKLAEDIPKINKCLEFIQSHTKYSSWCRTPFHLDLVTEVFRDEKVDTENEGKLIKSFVHGIYQREQNQGKDLGGIEVLNSIFGELAYKNVQSNSYSMPYKDVCTFLKGLCNDIGSNIDVPKIVDILVDSRVLASREGNISFAHEIYQEYFAAQYDDEGIEPDQNSEKWARVKSIKLDLSDHQKRCELITKYAEDNPSSAWELFKEHDPAFLFAKQLVEELGGRFGGLGEDFERHPRFIVVYNAVSQLWMIKEVLLGEDKGEGHCSLAMAFNKGFKKYLEEKGVGFDKSHTYILSYFSGILGPECLLDDTYFKTQEYTYPDGTPFVGRLICETYDLLHLITPIELLLEAFKEASSDSENFGSSIKSKIESMAPGLIRGGEISTETIIKGTFFARSGVGQKWKKRTMEKFTENLRALIDLGLEDNLKEIAGCNLEYLSPKGGTFFRDSFLSREALILCARDNSSDPITNFFYEYNKLFNEIFEKKIISQGGESDRNASYEIIIESLKTLSIKAEGDEEHFLYSYACTQFIDSMQRRDRGKCHTEDYHYAALLDIHESFIGKVGGRVLPHIPYRANALIREEKYEQAGKLLRENLEYRDTFTGAGDFDIGCNLAWLIVKKKIPGNPDEVKELLKTKVQDGDAEGIICLSHYYFNRDGLERSKTLLSGLAKKGNARAMMELGGRFVAEAEFCCENREDKDLALKFAAGWFSRSIRENPFYAAPLVKRHHLEHIQPGTLIELLDEEVVPLEMIMEVFCFYYNKDIEANRQDAEKLLERTSAIELSNIEKIKFAVKLGDWIRRRRKSGGVGFDRAVSRLYEECRIMGLSAFEKYRQEISPEEQETDSIGFELEFDLRQHRFEEWAYNFLRNPDPEIGFKQCLEEVYRITAVDPYLYFDCDNYFEALKYEDKDLGGLEERRIERNHPDLKIETDEQKSRLLSLIEASICEIRKHGPNSVISRLEMRKFLKKYSPGT